MVRRYVSSVVAAVALAGAPFAEAACNGDSLTFQSLDAGSRPASVATGMDDAGEASPSERDASLPTEETPGVPITLATGQTPCGLAVDSTSVYWTNADTVAKVSVNGGPVTTLASGQVFAYGAAVQGGRFYWATGGSDDGGPPAGTIASVPVQGGDVTVVVGDVYTNYLTDDLGGIAADGQSVFWFSVNDSTGTGALMSVPLSGGAPLTIVSSQALTQIGATVVTDGANVYWATSNTVMAAGIDGGLSSTLAYGEPGEIDLAVSAGTLSWVEESPNDPEDAGLVWNMPAGGDPLLDPELASSVGLSIPLHIVADGTTVYVTDSEGVKKVPGDGGAPTLLAAAPFAVWLAIDSTSVYWSQEGPCLDGGTCADIMKLTPR